MGKLLFLQCSMVQLSVPQCETKGLAIAKLNLFSLCYRQIAWGFFVSVNHIFIDYLLSVFWVSQAEILF